MKTKEMTRKELEAVLDELAAVQPYEYPLPVLPTSGAITDQLVQKLKINSFQRKIRNFEVGSTVIKTVQHSNIKVVKALEEVKDRIKDAEQRCKDMQEGRREIVEEVKLHYKNAQNDIRACESALKKWEDLENNQKQYMKLVKKEIENLNKKCKTLNEKILILKKVRDYCLKFYKDYYLYARFMEEVRTEYVCDTPFVKFKQFLDEHYVKKNKKRHHYEENVRELFLANDALKRVLDGPFKKCKDTLKEALLYFDGLCDEEHKCTRYKTLLNKTQQFTANIIDEKNLALIALDNLVKRLMKTFPKRLFKGIALDTLQGKLQVVKFSFEAYTIMNELIPETNYPMWDLSKLAAYDDE